MKKQNSLLRPGADNGTRAVELRHHVGHVLTANSLSQIAKVGQSVTAAMTLGYVIQRKLLVVAEGKNEAIGEEAGTVDG